MRNGLLPQTHPYCGITFNDQRSARLLAHLEKTILSNMTIIGGSLYDVRFAIAVAGAASPSYSSGAASAKPKAEPRGRPPPNQSQAQTACTDPCLDEEPPTHEAALLGGEQDD